MEVSQVVVLDSRPVVGKHSKGVDCKSNFITEKKGILGLPGPFTSVVAWSWRLLMAKWC
jgi:hypothetical protein